MCPCQGQEGGATPPTRSIEKEHRLKRCFFYFVFEGKNQLFDFLTTAAMGGVEYLPSPETHLPLVKHGELAGGKGALGLIEN